MRVGRIIAVFLALALLVAVGAFIYVERATKTPLDPSAKAVEITIPKGATQTKVGALLQEKGIIKDALYWKLYLKMNAGSPGPKAGRHEVSASMNIPELVQAVASNPIPDDVPLTMVEGWRLRDADAALAEKGLIDAGAYLAAANDPSRFEIPFPAPSKTLEGFLLPETYMVPPGKVDVDALIKRQLEAFNKRFVEPHQDEIAKSGRTLSDLVKMASILEREEPKPVNRPKVAGVLYKRLDANTPLGVDATSRYTIDQWNDRKAFLKKLRDPGDPYNTRLKEGLPPTPIGAPSLDSLVASMRPVKSKYWYYLHDAKQNIHFARTAAEHEANRKRYNVW